MPIFLFLLTILSRLPFTSSYLYHMDSGHFALALDNYNLALHQPHPPGYFLYVMLGRLVRFAVGDANTTLILLSILFSGLTVVVMYYLGREVLDEKLGILAALLMATSPNFWFHGEVALSYPADAFFSALIGLLCWRVYQGKTHYVWISAVALALSSGFRQNTGVFLFPLWLYAVRRETLRSIAVGLGLFGIVSAAWFIPMILLTGGIEFYQQAFHELWLFHTGHNSVFEKGLPHLWINTEVLFIYTFYNLAILLPFMILALYGLLRSRKLSMLINHKTFFLVCWFSPTILFYLLVFISGNPGYGLILLPPFILIATASLSYLGSTLPGLAEKRTRCILAAVVIAINTGIFFFVTAPVTRKEIVNHDRNMRQVLAKLSAFKPNETILFADPYTFYSFRHIMLYLPQFTVWQVDVRKSSTGETRRQFGGAHEITFLSEQVDIPESAKYFAAIVLKEPALSRRIPAGLSSVKVAPDIFIVSGPIEETLSLYPELKPYWFTSRHTDARNCNKGVPMSNFAGM